MGSAIPYYRHPKIDAKGKNYIHSMRSNIGKLYQNGLLTQNERLTIMARLDQKIASNFGVVSKTGGYRTIVESTVSVP